MLNLTKGARFALTKDNPGLTKVNFAAGWKENEHKGGEDFDVDLSCALLRNRQAVGSADDVLYFNSNKSDGKNWDDKSMPYPFILAEALRHSGDERKGSKEGDDEVITIDLAKLPADVTHIVPFVNIHQAATRKQNFGLISQAFIRIDNADTKAELAKFNLSDDFYQYNGVVVGYLEKKDGEWIYVAKSLGLDGDVEQIALGLTKTLQL